MTIVYLIMLYILYENWTSIYCCEIKNRTTVVEKNMKTCIFLRHYIEIYAIMQETSMNFVVAQFVKSHESARKQTGWNLFMLVIPNLCTHVLLDIYL